MTSPPPPRAGIYNRQSMGAAKSIDDQDRENRAAAAEHGWQVTVVYADGASAWRDRAARDDWGRVLADIEAGHLDVLILWEPSRGDRVAETWLGLLRRCRETGVLIHVTSEDTTYDMRKTRDWRHLAEQGLDSEVESDKTSKRVRRGQKSAAADGHPSQGRTPYGYTRTREVVAEEGQKPRVVVRQHIDPATAPIVREIFRRLEQHEAVGAICSDLNSRAVPTLTAQRWYRARLTDLAKNPAYIAIRRYNGQETPGDWPAIVEAEQFYAVQRILSGAGHKRTSPGQQKHLLSYLGGCAVCGADLCAVLGRYKCLAKGCVTVTQPDADDLVTRAVLARLADRDVHQRLRRAGAQSDRAVLDARNEVATLQDRLDGFRRSAARGETSPASLAAIEADLTGQIEAARRREREASAPPALRPYLEPGADVQALWGAANLPGRRAVIRALAVVSVGRAARPGSRAFDHHRFGPSRWHGDTKTWGERWASTVDAQLS